MFLLYKHMFTLRTITQAHMKEHQHHQAISHAQESDSGMGY